MMTNPIVKKSIEIRQYFLYEYVKKFAKEKKEDKKK